MGKEFQMARSKATSNRRRTKAELLAEGRARVPRSTSNRRNKRAKRTKADKGPEVRAIEDTEAEGKISPEAQDSDGDSVQRPKRGRYKASDKDRKSDTGVKGEDRVPRRSASELGIEWIGDYCPDGRPHYLVDKHTFDGGSLFKCNNCSKHVWLPTYIKDARELELLINLYGANTGYCKFLDKNRNAKIIVAKLQYLWYERRRVSNDDEFRELVLSIMEEKDYDRIR
jgi:hypothetical protein